MTSLGNMHAAPSPTERAVTDEQPKTEAQKQAEMDIVQATQYGNVER